MKWFEGITDLKEPHRRLMRLAPIYHPDYDTGDEAIMKTITAEYNDLKHWMQKLLEKESEGLLWSNGQKEPIKYKSNSDEYEFEYQKKDDYDFTSDFYNASCEEQDDCDFDNASCEEQEDYDFGNASCEEQDDCDFDNEMYSYEVKFVGKKNALEFLKGLFVKTFETKDAKANIKVHFMKSVRNQSNKAGERYCRGKIRRGAVWRTERR